MMDLRFPILVCVVGLWSLFNFPWSVGGVCGLLEYVRGWVRLDIGRYSIIKGEGILGWGSWYGETGVDKGVLCVCY